MHLATGGIVFGLFAAVYLLVLFFENQRRDSRMINDHPFSSTYDPARGAARQGSADATEVVATGKYARGTR
jgi:hypothetical protein